MLFLGESAHRRFPLVSYGLRLTVRRSELSAAALISPIGRISPVADGLGRVEPADNVIRSRNR